MMNKDNIVSIDREALMAILREIDEYADDIRGDWSNFDGRDNRHVLNDFTSRIAALVPEQLNEAKP